MIALLLALAAAQPADSLARHITVAPAESLKVTVVGPADGPTLVIVPGLISPAYAFRKILPGLTEAGVRTVIIEPLGVGWSSRPDKADYSHSAQAARIGAIMDSLHLSHVTMMGHAVGTAIALRLVTSRPNLVDRLLLVEGVALESAAVPGVQQALKFSFLVKLFAGRGRIKKELKKGLMATSGDTTWVTDSVIENYAAGPAGDMGQVMRALKGMQRAVEPDSLRPKLNHITIPVRLLVGGAAHTGGVGEGRIRTGERRIPDFEYRTVIGAGLHIHEEQPDTIVKYLLMVMRKEW
jgi:pimeloyl-ACP methyl ester carboxylesterase